MPRAATITSGENRRTSGKFGTGGNVIMPGNIGRMQEPQYAHGLDAGNQQHVGCGRQSGGAAQGAVVARVGRREWELDRCRVGRCFAVTNDGKWIN